MLKKNESSHIIPLTLVFAILLIIGLANLYSAGADKHFFDTQLQRVFIGITLYVIIAWVIPIKFFNTYAYLIFGVTVLALIIVLFFGYSAGGAKRWLLMSSLRVQPSEAVKITLALCVAKFFYNRRTLAPYSLSEITPLLLVIGFIFVLIFKQPDFGTAGICLLIILSQLFFIRIKISMRAILAAIPIIPGIMALGWFVLLRDYQKLRVLNFFNPRLDPSGSGYNSLQSLVAIGSGRQFGKGFLQGTQSQLQFLPAKQTDFIFSVFAEEHGFWGSMLIFFLFICLIYIALEIARESKDVFNSLLAIGMAAFILIETSLNVAMVLGFFPVVGMPLPFFSFGGSALLAECTCIALLAAIDRENRRGLSQNRSIL